MTDDPSLAALDQLEADLFPRLPDRNLAPGARLHTRTLRALIEFVRETERRHPLH